MSEQDDELAQGAVFSLLDTDLYKLTMQCAVLQHFPTAQVVYTFTNRTPHMKLTRRAYGWLKVQIKNLANLKFTTEELDWVRKTCPYYSKEYLTFLETFRLRPDKHVFLTFSEIEDSSLDGDATPGDIEIKIRGSWLDTILYEIPILALVSEAYFKFVDRDWNHEGQQEKARGKARELLQNGCMFSDFGTRRRRDYHTHDMVVRGLAEAQQEGTANGWSGKFTNTSNAHLAMKHDIAPVGTVAHEWIMGIAALTDDYAHANENAMRYWIATFGRGTLAIALTDTFGTPDFLRAFALPATSASDSETTADENDSKKSTFAEVFTGVRQDSGDPMEYLRMVKKFYSAQGINERKAIVYSDSLNVEKCIRYKKATDDAGLTPSFGIGTFFTNDFMSESSGRTKKSVPLNIVIKLSEGSGRAAVKLSDDKGKNMGGMEVVERVKSIVSYEEREWKEGDEAHRWDK